jgi:hypothetical protein
MPETLQPILLDGLNHIVKWTQAWYEEALAARFVRDPYEADADVMARLHQYFRAGLTPLEAAQAMFGLKH